MIIKMLTVGSFASNCYIVGSSSSREGMIIDPGADAETIMRTVQQTGLVISIIVITHAHMDHVGALREVQQKTNAQFAVHEAEKGFVFSAPMRMLTSLGLSPVKSPPRPDRLLKDGDRIDVGDLHLVSRHESHFTEENQHSTKVPKAIRTDTSQLAPSTMFTPLIGATKLTPLNNLIISLM